MSYIDRTGNAAAAEAKAEAAWSLAAALTSLPESVIDSMKTADNGRCIGKLSAAYGYLSEQQQVVLQRFVTDDFNAALQVLLQSAARYSVLLKNIPQVPVILSHLCERLINAGASPAMAFDSLKNFHVLPGGDNACLWLGTIIRHTRSESREAAVAALGNGTLKTLFITVLNECFPEQALSANSTSQKVLETWKHVPVASVANYDVSNTDKHSGKHY